MAWDKFEGEIEREFATLARADRVGQRLKFVALISIGVALMLGLFGVWRAQAQSAATQKAVERNAHARAYGELASPGTRGAARVQGITVTDGRVSSSAAGVRRLYFTVVNTGQNDDLLAVDAGGRATLVDDTGTAIALGHGLALPTGATVHFAPDGRSFMVTAPVATRVPVTLTFRHAGTVRFDVPVTAG